MSLIRTIEEVVHSNGSKTIYHKWINTSEPKVRRVGFNYFFNSRIVKIEHIPTRLK